MYLQKSPNMMRKRNIEYQEIFIKGIFENIFNIKEINNINFFSINTYIDYDENKENQEKVDIILNHIKENADKLN